MYSLADLAHEFVRISFVRRAFGPKIAALESHFRLLQLAEFFCADGQQVPVSQFSFFFKIQNCLAIHVYERG